jgi:predicted membrane protein (TIGR00267 family)
MVLGVNDGLVSTYLLVAGVVGAGLQSRTILLTALAGAVAGAVSMAAGEFLATQSQEEVFDAEEALERTHIKHFKAQEVDQMRGFIRDMGVSEDEVEPVVQALARDDETLLNAMKALEFGIIDSERRSPYAAMFASGILFLLGSLTSVIPFLFNPTVTTGLVWASILTAVGLFLVGVAKTAVTKGNPITAGFQNLVIASLGGVVAFYIGRAFGAAIV